jgi:hypothetical protein
LINSGADLNCIQEGLIPRKYFEKSNQRLNSATGTKLQINYELNNVHVYQDGVYFHIPSVLVKNMSDKVILGIPFISMLYPFKAELGEVSTIKMGVQVRFQFASRFEIDFIDNQINTTPTPLPPWYQSHECCGLLLPLDLFLYFLLIRYAHLAISLVIHLLLIFLCISSLLIFLFCALSSGCKPTTPADITSGYL